MGKKIKLGFLITMNCNFKCIHCLSKCPFNEELRLKDYIHILNIFKNNLELVSFSGGEPILHSQFREIIKETVKRKLRISLISNGYFYRKYSFLLKHKKLISSISISLNGNEKIHDMIRKKGSFERVMKAIDFFKKENVKVNINYAISKPGLNEVEDVIKILAEKGVNEIRLGAIIENEVNRELVISVNERKKIYWKIMYYTKKYKLKIKPTAALYTLGGVEICPVLGDQTFIFVNQNGELMFCCNIGHPYGLLGKIKKSNINKLIIKRENIKMRIRDDRLVKLLNGTLNQTEEHTCEYCNHSFKKMFL